MLTNRHAQTVSDWDTRSGRRVRAWELHTQGWKQKDIAAALGVSSAAVSQWLKRAQANGVEQLGRNRPIGTTPRLSSEQLVELDRLLGLGPEAFGFVDSVWTSKRVAAVIQRWFGVKYHRGHVSKLLRSLGRHEQVPALWKSQRDELVIQAWWDAERPRP